MARPGQSFILTGVLLAALLMPDSLRAGPVPVGRQEGGGVAEVAEEEPDGSFGPTRTRRSVAYYKQLPEFWAWYKYYVDTHNQEGIENMDKLYLIYLQHKHRVEGGGGYGHYLGHLSEVYKACAQSDDPDCIPEYTSRPTAQVGLPAALKQAPVCNPYLDPYCLYAPATAPAPIKSPGPVLAPVLPMPMYAAPSGYHYYAPLVQPFVSAEQQAELLRVCDPSDVECLQYHLRAAHGYRPALAPVSPYAMLGRTPAGGPAFLVGGPKAAPGSRPECHPYDPTCSSFAPPAPMEAARDDVVLPHPDCDPEIDYDCRLRRARPGARAAAAPQERPAPQTVRAAPRFEDFLRGYLGYYKK